MFPETNLNNRISNNSNLKTKLATTIVIIKDSSTSILQIIMLIAWDHILDRCNKKNFIEKKKREKGKQKFFFLFYIFLI